MGTAKLSFISRKKETQPEEQISKEGFAQERVAAKYNVPYHYNESFFKAVRSHYRTLKKFGKQEVME